MNDFCANFYELWHYYYLGDFSKYMYDAGLYPEVFYLMLGFVVVPLVLYYIVVDHIQLARRTIWLLIVTAFSLVSAVAGSVVAENGVNDYLIKMNIHHTTIAGSDSVSFGLIVFFWGMVLSLVFSLLLQHGSVKSRRIPF